MLLGGKSIVIALPPLSDGRSEKSVSYGGGNVTICKGFDFLYSFGGLCFPFRRLVLFLVEACAFPCGVGSFSFRMVLFPLLSYSFSSFFFSAYSLGVMPYLSLKRRLKVYSLL